MGSLRGHVQRLLEAFDWPALPSHRISLPNLNAFEVLARVELKSPGVLLEQALSLEPENLVWDHDIRVNWNHVHWTVGVLALISAHLKEHLYRASVVCATAFESDWVKHDLATDDAGKVVRNLKLLKGGTTLFVEYCFDIILKFLSANLLVFWMLEKSVELLKVLRLAVKVINQVS